MAGSADGNLYAMNGQSGSYEWVFHAGTAATSPQVRHGIVYVGSSTGTVYAVNAQTGSPIWHYNVGAAVSAPQLGGDLVIVSAGNQRLYALNAATGVLAWQVPATGGISPDSPMRTDGSPSLQFVVAGSTIYLGTNGAVANGAGVTGSSNSSLAALDLTSGVLRWRVTLASSFLVASLRAASGTVFAGSTDGSVWALNAATGAVRWRYAPKHTEQTPGSAMLAGPSQGSLFVTGADNSITALESATGAVRWRSLVQGTVPAAVAIGGTGSEGQTLYAGSWDGMLYALNARTGAIAWHVRFPAAIYTTPLVLDATLYVSGTDGNLYAVNAATGALGWQYHAGATYTVPAAETPADLPGNPAVKGRYFPETGHDLTGAFLAFWDRYGGPPVFGYPITQPYSQNGETVQFTLRFGLVLKNGVVSTMPLGSAYTAGTTFPKSAPPVGSTSTYFAATGQSLSGRFLTYWQAHHGDVLLGAPISGVVYEGNGDGSGRRYQLQWFERGRLEYHPENAHTPYEMQLGLLGTQTLQVWGWLS